MGKISTGQRFTVVFLYNTVMGLKTLILVHGAWHGHWCWKEVQNLLSEMGVSSLAVELPFTSFEDDVKEVESTISKVDGPIVLVGHSYGGKVISKAAQGTNTITDLIYLCAFLLRENEPFAGEGQEPHPSLIKLEIAEDMSCTVRSEAITPAFYEGVEEAMAKEATSKLRPLPVSSFGPGEGEAWRSIQTTYVVCNEDAAIHPERQRQMADLADLTVEWDCAHSPFFSNPKLVADFLSTYDL